MADDVPSNNTDIPRGLINRTGNPIGRGSRLPSVRGHRDLTLGGIQRKVFVPNLAAVKKSISKDDTKPSPSSSQMVDKQEANNVRGRGKSDRGRGRGRGRGEDRTIQLQSEFAYGPMGGSSSGWSRSRGGEGGGGGGGGGGSKSGETDSTAIKAAMRHSKGTEEDKKLLESLMKDNFISDMGSGDSRMTPIRLPLNINSGVTSQGVKSECKEETMETDEPETKVEIKPMLGVSFSHNRPHERATTLNDILSQAAKSERGELLFLQFPDTLPGLPASAVVDDRTKASTSNGSVNKEDELAKRLDSCQLKDCNEGYMGKLRIRKSGKAELVLGDNVMEVLPGIPINFHQELVSVRTDHNPGQMVVLGPVKHKLMVAPDYNHLLGHDNKFL